MRTISTGVSGLDEMLNGGLPAGRTVIISGGPGSGKTCFGLQFLVNGIIQNNENGLFVSLEEATSHLVEEAAGFGWNLNKLIDQGSLSIVDASPIHSVPGEFKLGELKIGKKDFSMGSLIETLKSEAAKIGAKRIVLDALTNLIVQYPYSFERRLALLDLLECVSGLEATTLLTIENRSTSLSRKVSMEEFLCSGVIVFHVFREGGQLVRAVQVEKMRGIAHDEQLRPYRITNKGVIVYNREDSVEIPAEITSTT